MTIKPIKTHDDYKAALAEVERLFNIDKTADDYDRLDLLATLVEAYEAKHYPIGPPDPVAAIEYEMEKRVLSRRDLEPIIGPSGRVSEILNRQRSLTMTMIRNLHSAFGISGDILLSEYPLVEKASTRKRPSGRQHISPGSDLSIAG
jgi:HTH-type transcriptional regulator/antitoxin HigA